MGLNFALPPAGEVSTDQEPTVQELTVPESTVQAVDLVRVSETLPPLMNIAQVKEAEVKVVDVASEVFEVEEPTEIKKIGLQFSEDSLQMPVEQKEEQTASLFEDGTFIGLSFGEDLVSRDRTLEADRAIATPITSQEAWTGLDDWIFEGGSRSLVAHTVGSAEGTRRWNGDRTQAYYGHVDPGNGVWNLGTFSYQHGAKSPEEADEKQIRRLKSQSFELVEKADQQGLKLSLTEKLNGIDLANQAPVAALGKGGYVERLAEAYESNMHGEEAIAFARTKAYIDPDTKRWDAPGLGNNLYSIRQDQQRRMSAIDSALQAYERAGSDRLAVSNLERISVESSNPSEMAVLNEDSVAVTFALPPAPAVTSEPSTLEPVVATEGGALDDIGETSLSDSIPEPVSEAAESEAINREAATPSRLSELRASVLKPVEPAARELVADSNADWSRTEDKIVNKNESIDNF